MAISIAQQKDGGVSSNSLAITLTNPTVNGNGIVVSVGTPGITVTSVTDNASNTYTQRRTDNFSTTTVSYIYDCVNISGNPTTITVHTSVSTTITARVYEVNGTLTAKTGSNNHANSSAIAPGAITTTDADTIWFLSVHTSSSGGYTQPSGWTLDTNANTCQFSSKVFTATQSSVNPTGSNNPGGASACLEAYTSTNTGSVVYNKSVSATLTLTETQTTANVLKRSVASTAITFTETQTQLSKFAPSLTSTLTLTEANSLNYSLGKPVSETLTLTETQTTKNVLKRSISQILTLVSTPLPIGITAHTVPQTLTFSEAQTYVGVLNTAVSQGLGIANLPSVTTVLNLELDQTLTLVSTPSRSGSVYNESVTSTATFSETQTYTAVRPRSVSETLTLTETQTTQDVLNRSVSESLTLVSTPTRMIIRPLEVDQTVSFTQHIAKAIQVDVTSTLTLTGTAFPINLIYNQTDPTVRQKTPIASTGSNGGTLVLNFGTSTFVNDGIVLVVGNQGGGVTISSVTDDAGNTYTLLQDSVTFGSPRTRIYYCPKANALNSITLHLSTTGSQLAALAYEVSGVITADSGSANIANSTSQAPGAITTTALSTLVFAADTCGFTPTAPVGWNDDGQAQNVRFIHNIYSGVQTGLNPTFTASSLYASAQEAFGSSSRGGVHSTLTLAQSIVETRISNYNVPQNLNLSQPNRIPLNYSLKRSVNQALTFTESQAGVASKSVSESLTFVQDVEFFVAHKVTHQLDLGQVVAVQLVVSKSVNTVLVPFQRIAPQLRLNIAEPQTLTLSQTVVGNKVHPVSSNLNLSQTVVGVASKSVKSVLTLTQSIHLNRTTALTRTHNLNFSETAKTNFSRAEHVSSAFGFSSFQKAHKGLTGSVTSTLALHSEVARERHLESVASVLTLSEAIAVGRFIDPEVSHVLQLHSNIVLAKATLLNVSNALTFLPTHNRFFGSIAINVPNVQAQISDHCTLLRGPDQVVVLPAAQFGDGQGNTGEFTLRFAINGKPYTYVKNNNTTKLNYNFQLSRSKCRELQRFLQKYQAAMVDLQNWKGEVWKVYITNNPFEANAVSLYGPGQNEERWDISLEFEGIRMN